MGELALPKVAGAGLHKLPKQYWWLGKGDESLTEKFVVPIEIRKFHQELNHLFDEIIAASAHVDGCEIDPSVRLPEPSVENSSFAYEENIEVVSKQIATLRSVSDWMILSQLRCAVERLIRDGLKWNAIGMDISQV